MLTLVRAVLGFLGFLAGWFVSYRFYFMAFDEEGHAFLARGTPLLVGLAAGLLVWALTARLQHGYTSSVVLGALGLGSAGCVLGFFSTALMALLLGVGDAATAQEWGSVLGSLGLLFGGPIGAFWWWRRRPAVNGALMRLPTPGWAALRSGSASPSSGRE